MPREVTLYGAVVEVSRTYLGPAGERFMRRQIETHLSKKPESIQENDIIELVTWSRLAFAMLTEDRRHIEAFTDDLMSLSDKKTDGSHAEGY